MKIDFLKPAKSDSTNRKIFKAAIVVGLLAILAKTAASVKELVVARAFGRSDILDAFLIAFLLPSFLVSLMMGALDAALIPVLVETRQREGVKGVQKLLSNVVMLSVLALVAAALLLGLLAPFYLPWIGHGFSSAKLRLTRELLYALLPFVLFSGLAIFLSSVLNAHERFGWPSAVSLVTTIVTMAFIVLRSSYWGAFSLVGGTVTGSALEAGLLFHLLRRQGIRLSWSRGQNHCDAATSDVLLRYAPMVAGALLMGSTSVVDQAMAAALSSGSVAALAFGNKITAAVLGVGGTALNTAALPYFSEMAADNDWQGCRRTLTRYSILIAATTVPFTAALLGLSRPLVRLLFQRGAFTSVDTGLVSWVQICYALQIPFYIWSMLFVRFLCSIRKNNVLLYIAAANLFVDVVLNLVLMRIWGVAGIALSTSLVHAVAFVLVAGFSIRFLAQQRSVPAPAAAQGQQVMR